MRTDESEAEKWRELLDEVVKAPSQMAFEVAIREARAVLGVYKGSKALCVTCGHQENSHGHPQDNGCGQFGCECLEFRAPPPEPKPLVTTVAVKAIEQATASGQLLKASYSLELALQLASLVGHHQVCEDADGRYVRFWDDEVEIELR